MSKNSTIKGKVTSVYGDDVNTDDIIPAYLLQESTDRKFFADYAFEKFDEEFVERCKNEKANIIVAGENFACGSSREQAVYAIQENNVVAVIAKSYPDIFYRNSLNNGLVVLVVDEIDNFKLGENLEIGLDEKIITNDGKTYPIKISDHDAEIFKAGGKLEIIKKDLTSLHSDKQDSREDYTKTQVKYNSPKTIAEKIVSDHIGREVEAGELIEKLPIDLLYFNEVIGPPAIEYFYEFFSETFEAMGQKAQVFAKDRVGFIPDHTVPSSSVAVSEGIDYMEQFTKKTGAVMFKEGDGIEHIVFIEEGYVVPGSIVLGTDSHTDTNGALNTMAFGVGTTDGSYAMATGYLYDFIVPKTIRFNLHGSFKKGVYAKDLILHLIGKLGVDGAVKNVIEFGGQGIKNISLEGRMTIANMGVEMGARTAIFEPDEILEEYVKDRAKFPYKTYMPDEGCHYEKVIDVNLDELEPSVAFPHKPGNVTPISEVDEYMQKTQKESSATLAQVDSLKITDAFLGACTNGRYEDFVEASKILKGKKVHPDVSFVAIPASRKIYNRLLKDGILEIFAEAGVNIESSNCGPCFGKHMGIISSNAQMISSSNRNYIGRMGSKKGKIFLASPATVAASAVKGEIVDPREML